MPVRVHSRVSAVLTIAGLFLVCAALFISNAVIERTLTGDVGRLAWGPTLFRVLLGAHGLGLIGVGFFGIRRRFGPDEPHRAAKSNGKTDGRVWATLCGLTVIALGLRLFRLDSCLWFDEVLTLLDFVRPPIGFVATTFKSQNQHMLYSILAKGSIQAFGETAWALRLPAVMFGVASLWALFLFGRRVVGTAEALLACALLTVSYHHIWFSQNARGYTGLLFFTTLTTWLWLEAMSRSQWRWWLAYAVTSALGLWVHLSMVFVLVAHGLLLLIYWSRSRLSRSAGSNDSGSVDPLKPIVAGVLCGTLSLQVYALSLPEFFRSALDEGTLKSDWTSLMWVIKESLNSLQIGLSGSVVVLAGAMLALVGWLSILRRDWRAGWAMVLPGVLGGGIMLLLEHNLWPRFFFFLMGFALVIVVHGAMEIPRLLLAGRRSSQTHQATAVALGYTLAGMILLASALTVPRCYALPKQDFTGARDFIESNRGPGEAVVAVGLAGAAYSRYFAPMWGVVRSVDELRRVRQGHATVWLVYTIPVQLRSFETSLWEAIGKDFEVVKVFPGTLSGGDVTVCRARALEPAVRPAQLDSAGGPSHLVKKGPHSARSGISERETVHD